MISIVQMTKFVNIITFARASLVASASAAMALCKFWGSLTSFTWIKKSKPVQLKYFTLAVTDQCHLHSFNVNTPWVCGSIDHGLQRRRSTYIFWQPFHICCLLLPSVLRQLPLSLTAARRAFWCPRCSWTFGFWPREHSCNYLRVVEARSFVDFE